jgi:hypothetical protein
MGMAACLRLLHLGWGLPSLLEEAMPLKVALGMIDPASGRVDLDPHFFNYPSLSIYLHLIVTQVVFGVGRVVGLYSTPADFLLSFHVDPTPIVVAARLVHALADVATVWAVFRIARRFSPAAGWIAAWLVAFSPVLLHTERTLIVDTLETTLLAWSIERLLAWQADPARHRLLVSALLLGLAASTKYHAAPFVAPWLWIVHRREPTRFARHASMGIASALLGFLATSPYLVIDAGAAWKDLAFEREHLASGHLGSEGHRSLVFHLINLGRTLGPVGLILLCIAPMLAPRDGRRPVLFALCAGALLLVAPIVIARYDAERYLAPAVPVAAVIAATAGAALLERARGRTLFATRAALVLGMAGPVAVLGVRAATEGADDTQRRAKSWCEHHLPSNALVIQEGWSAPLVSRWKKNELAAQPVYRQAGARWRSRFDDLPTHSVISIPLKVAGVVHAPTSGSRRVDAIEINRSYYDPALYACADYIVTSSAVRGRFESDPARFAEPIAFYRILDRHAEPAAVFESSYSVSGPAIRIYRVTAACRAALARDSLAATWWMRWSSRPGKRSAPPTPVTTDLRAIYADHFQGFATELAYASLARGDTLATMRLTRTTLAVDSTDAASAVALGLCLSARGAPAEAERVLRGALAADPSDPALRLGLARLEARSAALRRAGPASPSSRRSPPPAFTAASK